MAYDLLKLLGSAGSSLLSGALKPQTNTGSQGYGTTNTTNQQTSMRDYLGGYGITPSWSASNPNYTAIGQNSYKVGSIPGTSYDPTSSTHYVTDKTALNKALGLSPWDQTDQTSTPTTTTGYNTNTATIATPNYDYSTPYVEYPTWEEALSRAQARYEPQYQSAVLDRNKMASDQRERLAQMLGARGYSNPRGGQMQVGQGNITQEQAAALEGLRNSYDSTINQYASDIYNQESTGAAQKMNNLLTQQAQKNQQTLQQYHTDLGAALQKDLSDKNQYNNLLNFFVEMFLNE